MANRSMKIANQAIFAKLDGHCSSRQDPIQNAGEVRYIATTDEDQDVLKRAKLVKCLAISATVKVAKFELDGADFFVTCGLKLDPLMRQFQEVPLAAGMLTAFLYESGTSPIATPARIRDEVEFGHQGVSGYRGHTAANIVSLYRDIRVHTAEKTSPDDVDRLFMYLCLHDEDRTTHWMEEPLISALKTLTVVALPSIPYKTLSRSLFDIDPGALYLALYRCLEALYAYKHADALKISLKIARTWKEIARELEEKLSWWPKEESSLRDLLDTADSTILESVISAFPGGPAAGDNLPSQAAKRIYRLRNALVHYRPAHQDTSLEAYDWNSICAALASLILAIYPRVYESA